MIKLNFQISIEQLSNEIEKNFFLYEKPTCEMIIDDQKVHFVASNIFKGFKNLDFYSGYTIKEISLSPDVEKAAKLALENIHQKKEVLHSFLKQETLNLGEVFEKIKSFPASYEKDLVLEKCFKQALEKGNLQEIENVKKIYEEQIRPLIFSFMIDGSEKITKIPGSYREKLIKKSKVFKTLLTPSFLSSSQNQLSFSSCPIANTEQFSRFLDVNFSNQKLKDLQEASNFLPLACFFDLMPDDMEEKIKLKLFYLETDFTSFQGIETILKSFKHIKIPPRIEAFFAGYLCKTMLANPILTTNALEALKELNPSYVDLSKSDISDEKLKQLFQLYPEIKGIVLDGTDITDVGIKELKKGNFLTKVSLMNCYHLSDQILGELTECQNLKEISFHNHTVKGVLLSSLPSDAIDESIKKLQKLPYLETLSLTHAFITGKALQELSKSSSLKHITLKYCEQLDPLEINKFIQNKQIETFSFASTKESSFFKGVFINTPSLKTISAQELRENEILEILTSQTLTSLTLNGCQITDSVLEKFLSHPTLTTLRLKACPTKNVHLYLHKTFFTQKNLIIEK